MKRLDKPKGARLIRINKGRTLYRSQVGSSKINCPQIIYRFPGSKKFTLSIENSKNSLIHSEEPLFRILWVFHIEISGITTL